VATLLLGCDALAADPELLGILDSSADPGIASYLNAPVASESSKPTEQSLKSLSALGVSFSGRANPFLPRRQFQTAVP
jgi:hypothetical protein